jgi:hypothetical protein
MPATKARNPTRRRASRDVAQWFVVLRPDGLVESAEGGAPVTWLGRSVLDAPGMPEEIRWAAAELMSAPPSSFVRKRTSRCVLGDVIADVELLVVDGLPLRRAHTRVHELVMRTLDLFASQAKSSAIDMAIEQAKEVPPVVLLDGEKIAWVISTLVGNALRYARAHVVVKVRWDEPTAALVVDVKDDGPGMPPDRARWLFARDPRTGKSAGLALLMVSDIMAAHRGSIGVHSHEGKGTTFTIRIPRLRAPS